MRTALFAAALFAPLAASAQFSLTSDANAAGSPIFIGRSTCASKVIHFHWDLGSGQPSAGSVVHTIRARSTSACASSTAPTAPDQIDVDSPPQTQTGNTQAHASELILDTTSAGLSGGCANTDRSSANPWTTYYCVQLVQGSAVVSQSIQVKFAMANPKPPTGVLVQPGDQHLKVNWSAGDPAESIATYDVHVLEAGATLDPLAFSQQVSGQTSADVTRTDSGAPLQNDQPYTIQVIATDSYGNQSAPSAGGTGTPTRILDFYGLYRNDGGSAAGGHGCSSAGAATWAALFALAAVATARRRKLRKGGLLLLGLALLAPPGRAAEWRGADRPPRHFLVAFKLDRYDPKIDSEPAFASLAATDRPYYQIFRGRVPLRYQLELDWEVAHPFGSVLLGATAGYWQNIGKGLVSTTGQPSGDTALLDVLPFGVIATYRFDWLADRWVRFPFIPYVQAGLQRALWASFSGGGSVSKDVARGGRGSGWTSGYTTALGVALNLDAIDPDLAREAYVDAGIQRTALFAEYGWTRLDDFRGRSALILSDRAWRFGLSMEF